MQNQRVIQSKKKNFVVFLIMDEAALLCSMGTYKEQDEGT